MNDLVKIENNEIIIAKEYVEQYKQFLKIKEEFDLKDKIFKQQLKDAMEEKGIKKFIVNGLCATIKDATTRTSLDTKKLKEELPDIWEEYSRTSQVSSSITLTIGE